MLFGQVLLHIAHWPVSSVWNETARSHSAEAPVWRHFPLTDLPRHQCLLLIPKSQSVPGSSDWQYQRLDHHLTAPMSVQYHLETYPALLPLCPCLLEKLLPSAFLSLQQAVMLPQKTWHRQLPVHCIHQDCGRLPLPDVHFPFVTVFVQQCRIIITLAEHFLFRSAHSQDLQTSAWSTLSPKADQPDGIMPVHRNVHCKALSPYQPPANPGREIKMRHVSY